MALDAEACPSVPAGYRFEKDKDINGYDINSGRPILPKDVVALAQACSADSRCRSFNTHGWIKTADPTTGPMTAWTPNQYCGGLYIKTTGTDSSTVPCDTKYSVRGSDGQCRCIAPNSYVGKGCCAPGGIWDSVRADCACPAGSNWDDVNKRCTGGKDCRHCRHCRHCRCHCRNPVSASAYTHHTWRCMLA